jgi:hypothetical protein
MHFPLVESAPFGIAGELLAPSWEGKCFCGSKNIVVTSSRQTSFAGNRFLCLRFVFKLTKTHCQL